MEAQPETVTLSCSFEFKFWFIRLVSFTLALLSLSLGNEVYFFGLEESVVMEIFQAIVFNMRKVK